MAVITDGFGPNIVPAGSVARRAWSLPSPPERAGRTQSSEQAGGPGEASRLGNPARWAEAAATRQLDRTLGRLSDKTHEIGTKLEQVKMYPPYPIDEPRRAAAIREFNGLAAEVQRMNVIITALDPHASTAEAEQAVTSLTQVGEGLQGRRAGLAAAAAVPGAGRAEGQSLAIGGALGDTDVGGISRQAGDVLRQIG